MSFQSALLLLLLALCNLQVSSACEQIDDWQDLIVTINAAQRNDDVDELRLCPFQIRKPATVKLVLNRALIIRCDKLNDEDECRIVADGGLHAQIQGPGAQITIIGFTFVGATTCAVRLYSTALQPQNLIDCHFIK